MVVVETAAAAEVPVSMTVKASTLIQHSEHTKIITQ